MKSQNEHVVNEKDKIINRPAKDGEDDVRMRTRESQVLFKIYILVRENLVIR